MKCLHYWLRAHAFLPFLQGYLQEEAIPTTRRGHPCISLFAVQSGPLASPFPENSPAGMTLTSILFLPLPHIWSIFYGNEPPLSDLVHYLVPKIREGGSQHLRGAGRVGTAETRRNQLEISHQDWEVNHTPSPHTAGWPAHTEKEWKEIYQPISSGNL